MTPERLLITAAKCLAATMIWIALAVILFRFGVGSLWGSRSDLGVAAALPPEFTALVFQKLDNEASA